MRKYRMLDHTSDIGIDVWGKTKKELFANATRALYDLMTILKKVEELEEMIIMAEGENIEDLLVNFLREALYLYNGKRWLIRKCEVMKLTATKIEARLFGEPYNLQKHTIKKEIKAVTYHGMSVKKTPGGWNAKVIFDV
jgi:SHS2 domain-containing protein